MFVRSAGQEGETISSKLGANVLKNQIKQEKMTPKAKPKKSAKKAKVVSPKAKKIKKVGPKKSKSVKKAVTKKVKVAAKKISKNSEDIDPNAPAPVKRKFIKKEKIDNTVYAVAGENGIKVVDFLGDRKNVSEFIIAEKLKLDMQTIRNTLYKLHTHNVTTYIRKKDRQKGWYISYWTFNKKRIRELVDVMKKMQIEKLRERLAKEEANKGLFFICSKACARLDFDQATDFEFKCPECGSLLQQQENIRTIEHLKERIHELETTI